MELFKYFRTLSCNASKKRRCNIVSYTANMYILPIVTVMINIYDFFIFMITTIAFMSRGILICLRTMQLFESMVIVRKNNFLERVLLFIDCSIICRPRQIPRSSNLANCLHDIVRIAPYLYGNTRTRIYPLIM